MTALNKKCEYAIAPHLHIWHYVIIDSFE